MADPGVFRVSLFMRGPYEDILECAICKAS